MRTSGLQADVALLAFLTSYSYELEVLKKIDRFISLLGDNSAELGFVLPFTPLEFEYPFLDFQTNSDMTRSGKEVGTTR